MVTAQGKDHGVPSQDSRNTNEGSHPKVCLFPPYRQTAGYERDLFWKGQAQPAQK